MSIYSTLVNTTNYIFDIGYNYFFVDCSGGDIELYMPENIYDNILIIIKRIDTTTNICNLHVNAIDNIPIDNSTTVIPINNYDFMQIISYNNKWWILNRQ